MKIVGGISFGIGILILAGTTGAADYYDQCRLAADCVAGEPMSDFRLTIQMLTGLVIMSIGVVLLNRD